MFENVIDAKRIEKRIFVPSQVQDDGLMQSNSDFTTNQTEKKSHNLERKNIGMIHQSADDVDDTTSWDASVSF